MLKETTKTEDGAHAERREGYDPVPAFKALGHPLRWSLFGLLAGGERCVCELVDRFGASQPLISHHLSVLKKAGLVRDRQDSTWVYYSVNPRAWESLHGVVCSLAVHPDAEAAPARPCPPQAVGDAS